MSENTVSDQLNYSKIPKVCPYYSVRKVLPQVSQTVTIGNSTQETIFEIPPVVFNLAQSTLYFDVAFPANQDLANFVPADTFPYIRQIQMYTRGDVMICDLNEVGNYLKIIYPPTTKFSDMASTHPSNAMNPVTTGINTGTLYRNADGPFVEDDQNAGQVLVSASALRANGGPPFLFYEEYRKYWFSDGENDPTPLFRIGFKLGNIKDTIFSVNKDLFFNETMYIKIVWNPYGKIYWRGDDAQDPTSDAQSPANGFNLTAISLFLKVEKNPAIVQKIQESVLQGQYQMVIPYTRVYKQQFGASAVQNVNYKFNRADGARIMKIWHSVFLADETANNIYDNAAISSANDGDEKVIEFHTELNNDRIQPFEIDTSTFQDYMLLEDKLRGSAVLNALIYQNSWFWVDIFDSQDRLCEESNYNELCGLSLNQEVKWDFVSTTAATAFIHYTYVNFQRALQVTSEGVFIS